MNSEQTRLALCIIIPALMVLLFIIWQFYCDERNRRKFYENKYYQQPRVHHYKPKRTWFARLFLVLIIFSLASCEKELPKKKLCMKCSFSFADKSYKIPDLDTCFYSTDPLPNTKFYDDKGNQASVNCTYY